MLSQTTLDIFNRKGTNDPKVEDSKMGRQSTSARREPDRQKWGQGEHWKPMNPVPPNAPTLMLKSGAVKTLRKVLTMQVQFVGGATEGASTTFTFTIPTGNANTNTTTR